MSPSDWTADRIRVLRLRLGCNQAEFARRLGFSLGVVREWENDLSFPSAECCANLAGLWELVENQSEALSKRALAETIIRSQHLAQISTMTAQIGSDPIQIRKT